MEWGKGDGLSIQTSTICILFLHKLLLSLFSDSQKAAFITLWNISFNQRSIRSLALLAAGCTCQRGSSVPEDMTRQFIPQRTDSRDASVLSSQLSSPPSSTGCHLHPDQASRSIHKEDNHICMLFKIRLTNIKRQHLPFRKIRQAWADYRYYFSSRIHMLLIATCTKNSSHISNLPCTLLGSLCSKRDLYSLIPSECQRVI